MPVGSGRAMAIGRTGCQNKFFILALGHPTPLLEEVGITAPGLQGSCLGDSCSARPSSPVYPAPGWQYQGDKRNCELDLQGKGEGRKSQEDSVVSSVDSRRQSNTVAKENSV